MPRLEVLVGMIASGKSTYARGRADEGAMIVSHDALTAMLHGRYRYEQDLRFAYRRAEERLVELWLDEGRDVVVDRTHLTVESRRRWRNFADTYNHPLSCRPINRLVTLVAVGFPIAAPYVHALRRCQDDMRSRTLEEWRQVAEQHFAQAMAEPLDAAAEGFDAAEGVIPCGDVMVRLIGGELQPIEQKGGR